MKFESAALCLLSLLIAGCGPKPDEDASSAKSAAVESAILSPVETVNGVTTVRIAGNDRMQFTLKEFTVRSGDTVRIFFTNTGRMPVNAMGHNVVFLNQGVDANAYAGKSALARDTDFIPESEAASVFAYTKLLGPDEIDTIEFIAPAPGDYTYICSFPAHCFAGMRGLMTVTAAE